MFGGTQISENTVVLPLRFWTWFERLVMFATGMSNIRDVIPFPRTPQNAEF